jgi:hypothetical protein
MTITETPSRKRAMIMPRKWIDVHGDRIEGVWREALEAIVGCLWSRPGISEVRKAPKVLR